MLTLSFDHRSHRQGVWPAILGRDCVQKQAENAIIPQS